MNELKKVNIFYGEDLRKQYEIFVCLLNKYNAISINDEGTLWVFKNEVNEFEIKIPNESLNSINNICTINESISDLIEYIQFNKFSKYDILFINHIEECVHPIVLYKLIEIYEVLINNNIDLVLFTNNYFIIKRIHNILSKNNLYNDYSMYEVKNDQLSKSELVRNSIIDVSIKIYEEEVKLCLNQ